MLNWLLMFHQAGIAVVIIHHANRDGNDMRGTSRREDAADWVIRVAPIRVSQTKVSQNFKAAGVSASASVSTDRDTVFRGMDSRGTTFIATFTKNREDDGEHEKSLDWSFVTDDRPTTDRHTASGSTASRHAGMEANWRLTDTRALAYELIKNGVEFNAEKPFNTTPETGISRFMASALQSHGVVKSLHLLILA